MNIAESERKAGRHRGKQSTSAAAGEQSGPPSTALNTQARNYWIT